MSNEPSSTNNADQCCTTTTVDEQKTCQTSKEDDPEQILVLQSQVVPASENKENFLKKVLICDKCSVSMFLFPIF